jgi:predicted nucleotidyltransferase
MGRTGPTLDKAEVERLLVRLGELAHAEGTRIDVFLVGGAAMALAYDNNRTTGDLDAVFEPKSRVYELARKVSDESDLDLPADWLNDGVKGFLPGADDDARGVLLDTEGISVTVASPRYLFVLKAMAARESDEGDLRTLYPLCGFVSADEALDAVETAYPHQQIRPAVAYLVRGIADEQNR